MDSASETLLELHNIHVHYGGVKALDGASIEVDRGEIVALMGPNGAGKSTLLKTIFGLAPISSGDIFFRGEKVMPVSYEMVRRGIAFVPQGRRVFTELTVEENLEVGGFAVRDKKELGRRMSGVMETFPVIREKRHALSGTLSGGQQQILALARGLMIDPKILLLDEPSLGLAPKVVKEMFEHIKRINERHQTAIVIVEHNIKSLLEIVDRCYVLDKGRVAAEGTPETLRGSDVLQKVFLGEME